MFFLKFLSQNFPIFKGILIYLHISYCRNPFFFFLQILQGSFPSSVRECARTRTRLCTKFRVNFLADWFWSKKLEMIQNDKDRHTPNFHKSIMHNFKITSNAIFILFWFSLAVKVALTPHPPTPQLTTQCKLRLVRVYL